MGGIGERWKTRYRMAWTIRYKKVLPRGLFLITLPDGTQIKKSTGTHLKPYKPPTHGKLLYMLGIVNTWCTKM